MAEKETSQVAPLDPFRELDLFRNWSPFRDFPGLRSLVDEAGQRWSPALDISEDDDQYAVTVELPGTKKEDVTVEAHENTLTIRGEKESEREEKKEQSRYIERTYGSFSRTFSLPADANGERIAASFADGVLTVEIPKREEAKPKTIAVK